MIRAWFRVWLGVPDMVPYTQSLVNLEKHVMETLKLQGELRAMLQELKELREMVNNPKLRPIVARTSQEYRKLMEDAG